MNIYIATSGEYSDYGIEEVFTDKKQAELFCATHGCYLEVYEADRTKIETEQNPKFIWECGEKKINICNGKQNKKTYSYLQERWKEMGYWIEENITCSVQECSNCNFKIDDDVSWHLYRVSFRKPKFCPECGEKMEYVKTDYITDSYVGEKEGEVKDD